MNGARHTSKRKLRKVPVIQMPHLPLKLTLPRNTSANSGLPYVFRFKYTKTAAKPSSRLCGGQTHSICDYLAFSRILLCKIVLHSVLEMLFKGGCGAPADL